MHHLARLVMMAPIAVILLVPAAAQPDIWPNKPVRIVVPLAPGGTSDMLGRTIAQQLDTKLNAKFYVENRPGAGGIIGAAYVAEQASDGYNLGISGIGSHVIAPAINSNVGFDPMKSFTHIAFLGGAPTALIAHPSLGIANVKELVERAPGQAALCLVRRRHSRPSDRRIFRAQGRPRPYPLSGRQRRPAGPHRRTCSGRLDHAVDRGSADPCRHREGHRHHVGRAPGTIPHIPTFAEAGYPDLVALTWFALSGPARLPRPIVVKLNEATVQAMTSPAVETETIQTQKMNAEEFTAFVQAEIDRWTPIALSTGVKPQ
jgi:tripartite-type tricarboxylate transporter receptor subunit TctC